MTRQDDAERLRIQVIRRESARGGFRGAVNAKCAECIYDPAALGAGTWRAQVEACTSFECPLFKFRPRTTHRNKD